jgi:hypothetical protein
MKASVSAIRPGTGREAIDRALPGAELVVIAKVGLEE